MNIFYKVIAEDKMVTKLVITTDVKYNFRKIAFLYVAKAELFFFQAISLLIGWAVATDVLNV